MCRFLAYTGPSTRMEDLLFNTSNSLVMQSRHAKLRMEPINGDGFGIGWYPKHGDPKPGSFVSIEPAWSNRNLLQISKKVFTELFFAHVRDATPGMAVSQSNCHPFQYEQYLWMHNGYLDEFTKTRRMISNNYSDKAFHYVSGNTDSEHIFALFLDQLGFNEIATSQEMQQAMLNSLKSVLLLRKESGANNNAQLNFAVSNGKTSIFTRFASHSKCKPPSLYYQESEAIIVASEPLTDDDNWVKVEKNHMLTIDEGQLQIDKIELASQDQL